MRFNFYVLILFKWIHKSVQKCFCQAMGPNLVFEKYKSPSYTALNLIPQVMLNKWIQHWNQAFIPL